MNSVQGSAIKTVQNYTYKTKDFLGKGAYSVVYVATNTNTSYHYVNAEQSVAIKIINKRAVQLALGKNSFLSELKILTKLKNCSNVIQIATSINEQNYFYLVAELCQTDMKKMIQKQKQLKQEKIIVFIQSFRKGLLNLFSRSIIHRDLKPANILIKNNQIKIGDFGVAVQSVQGFFEAQTAVGTLPYMAPQVLLNARYSHKSDIWAFGVIIYQFTTGNVPWRGENSQKLLKNINQNPIKKMIPKTISTQIKQFLQKCLDPNIQQRLGPDQFRTYCLASYISPAKSEKITKVKQPIQKYQTRQSNQKNQKIKNFDKQFKMPIKSQSTIFMNMKRLFQDSENKNVQRKIKANIFDQNINSNLFQNNSLVVPKSQKQSEKKGSMLKIDQKVSKMLSEIQFLRFCFYVTAYLNNYQRDFPYSQLIRQLQSLVIQHISDLKTQVSSKKQANQLIQLQIQQFNIVESIYKYEKKYQKAFSLWVSDWKSYQYILQLIDDCSSQAIKQIMNKNKVNRSTKIWVELENLKNLIHNLTGETKGGLPSQNEMRSIVEQTLNKNISKQKLNKLKERMQETLDQEQVY